MSIQPALRSQNPAPAPTTFSPTRGEKAREFVSSSVPTALSIGVQSSSLAAGTSSGSMAALGAAGSSASIVGGVLGAAQIAMNWGRSSPSAGASSGMAVGATIGSLIAPGVGTAIGAGVGAIVGGLIGCITAGKHKDQKVRDTVRESLVNAGVLNSDYQLQLPDGSLYDMGKDGGPRDEFGGRRPFEVDSANPLAQYAVGWIDPIMALLAPGNSKVSSDFAGYFANAVLSNARDLNDVRENVNFLLTKFGLTNETLAHGVSQLAQSGYVDESTAKVWLGGIQQRSNENFAGDFEMTRAKTPSAEAVTVQQ